MKKPILVLAFLSLANQGFAANATVLDCQIEIGQYGRSSVESFILGEDGRLVHDQYGNDGEYRVEYRGYPQTYSVQTKKVDSDLGTILMVTDKLTGKVLARIDLSLDRTAARINGVDGYQCRTRKN